MKMLVARMALATSVAFAMLIAAEAASAQTQTEGASDRTSGYRQAPEVYDTEANPNYGFGPRVREQPNDAVSGDRVIGQDPDPAVRNQLLREYDSGHPD
jgi:hypothetical protein